MPQKLTEQYFIDNLPEYMAIDWSTYAGTGKPCRFVDRDFGEFWTPPQNILHYGSSGHPKRWGIKRGLSKRLTTQTIIERLPAHTSIDMDTYKGYHTKARFIDDEYGDFWADPASVLHSGTSHPNRTKEKMRLTCLKKYGTEFAQQNRAVAQKMAKAQTKSKTIQHWNTNEPCTCVGSYEAAVVGYLNDNKINYVWQIPIPLPTGKTYICDLYLTDTNMYVEIKGFFRKGALEKWTLFQQIHPNSELWNKDKLVAMGLILKKTRDHN